MIWHRRLEGALNRVPSNFYGKVWQILSRTESGISVAGYRLPQVSKKATELKRKQPKYITPVQWCYFVPVFKLLCARIYWLL